MKTYVPTKGEIRHDWFVVDATDVVLGRLSTTVATLLRGKHKPTFTPGLDTGDFVIVVNAGARQADRQQVGRQAVLPPLRRSRAPPAGDRAASCATARPERHRALRGLGDAAEEPPGPAAPQEAQGVRGRRSIPHQAQQPQPIKVEG